MADAAEPTPVASNVFLHELAILAGEITNRGTELEAARQSMDWGDNDSFRWLENVDDLLRSTAADLLMRAEFLLALRAKGPTPPTPEAIERSRIVLLTADERDEIKAALEGDSNDAEHDVLVDLAQANDIEYTSFEDQD